MTNKKQVNKQDMLVIKASAGQVLVNSVPIDKTPAGAGFTSTVDNLAQYTAIYRPRELQFTEASAGQEIKKVLVNSIPVNKTPANVGFSQTQYLNNLNQNSWKIKTQEYFAPSFQRGFKITQPLNQTLENNLINLLTKINALRIDFNKPMIVSSGFRSPEHNVKIGGATHSTHLTCEAIDIVDNDGSLRRFCMENSNAILKKYNLFMEHPAYTKGWCHLQTRKPKSSNRVFIPYSGSPKEEHYDNSFKI